jgi:TonB-dependent receptor
VSGLRFEQNHMLIKHWDTVGEKHQFVNFAIDHDVLLPNLNISYQSDPELWFRFAARRAIARPSFAQLAEAESIEYDSLTDQVSTVSRANPQLKPEGAVNYDLSVEWYFNSSSILELSFYYKKINDLIYASSISTTLDNQVVTLIQPLNGHYAQLRGVDFHLLHQFDYLPYFWQNTGVDLSVTVQNSWMKNSFVSRTDVIEMPRAPQHSYKLKVFYQSDNFSAAANWMYTGKQLLSVAESSLDKYLQDSRRLDLSIVYRYSPFAFSLQLENVLNDTTFYKTLGKSTQYLGTQDAGGNGSFVQTGRVATFSASYQF